MARASGKPKTPRRARSLGAKVLLVLEIVSGTTIAFGVSVATVLHMDLAVTRRLVARTTNRILRPVFQGRLTIETLGRLGLDGFDGARVRIDDPTGRPVLTADGVSGRISVVKLLRIILGSSKSIEVDITEASVEHADLRFDTDSEGMPMLEHALTPVAVDQAPTPGAKPSRPIHVVISSARVRHAWVHGEPTWSPPVDLEGRDIEARVVVTDQPTVLVEVHKGQLLARALPFAGAGTGSLHGRVLVPSSQGNAVGITASFEGALGGIEENAELSLDGNAIAATLDVKEAAPENVRSLVPGYPVQDALTAHVDAHGTFPELDVATRAQLRGGGLLVLGGHVILSKAKRASFHATLAAIDLRGLAPGMPPSSLSAGIDATLALDEASGATGGDPRTPRLTGTATIKANAGTIGSEVVPAADVTATFDSGAHGPTIDGRVDANVVFRDPGLTGAAKLHLHPIRNSFELAFDASANAPRLNAISRVRLPIQGSVATSAHGTLAFDTFALNAEVEAHAQDLAKEPYAHVESATGTARIGGTVFAPRIDAKIHATSLDLSGVLADQADITATGLATAPHVHVDLSGGDVPDLSADADVSLGRATVLHDVRAAFARAQDGAQLYADDVRITSEGVSAERISIDGLGGPVHAKLRLAPHAIEARATGQKIDVGRLARLSGMQRWCTGGQIAFDVDATVHGGKAEGHATVDLTDAAVVRVRGATAHAELTLEDRRLEGRARAELGDLGSLEVVGNDLRMGKEGASSLRSWQRVSGSLSLLANVDMARLEELLPEGKSLPLRVAHGHLELEGKLKRNSMNDETPHLTLSAKTTELIVEDESPPPPPSDKGADKAVDKAVKEPRVPPKWRIEGVDFGVDARLDGESHFAEVAARMMDKKGPLVSIDAKSSQMPYAAILTAPSRVKEILSQVAFDATLSVPRRDLSAFPAALDFGGLGGELTAAVTVHGTAAAPDVVLEASLGQAHADAARSTLPVDLALTSHYAAGRADARLVATSAGRSEVMNAEAHVEGLPGPMATTPGAPWQASARAHLAAFPLGGVGFFEDRRMGGNLTGDVVLEGLHKDARATLDLAVSDLQIGDVSYTDAHVHAAVDNKTLEATAHLDHKDGSANAHAHAGASWGSALYPSLAEGEPVDLSVTAKQFRAETLLPFANQTLAELEGRIDGTAHLAYDRRGNKTELDGKVVYSHGKFEMSAALGEFHDATATLVLTPDGAVRIENASASGVTGKVQAAASARIASGKDGLTLGAARARVQIPKGEPIPITIEGTPLGTIDGTIDATESPMADGRGMTITLDVPSLHVALPASGSRSLQALGGLDDAEVGVRHGESREIVLVPLGPPLEQKTRAADARRIEIKSRMGADVEVKRGTDLKVGLEGQPFVTISDKVHVSGQIQLKKGGMLDIQGKEFEIEKGTISFVGDDPENPQVVVTAGWNAPDGTTRIFADYIGPLKTGKVKLRSEPPLAQTDIVALLLFGTAEGQTAAGQSATNATTSAANQAVGAAGGVATQPINHALDQFGVHAVSARVDTSEASNPKPEIEIQIAKGVSVQLAQVIGVPPPGDNPDTTLVKLNWRLLHGLTVSTTVGNLGSSIVDMVWERRY
jgi:translocation and assembly module TamB